jgi:hypothetical protein
VQQISTLLEAMGATPEEVAATLQRVRVQGRRDSTSFLNPIVRYLNRNLNIGGKLEIGAGGKILRLHLKSQLREVTLPVAVQLFLDGFHRGQHPDLEERSG